MSISLTSVFIRGPLSTIVFESFVISITLKLMINIYD